MRVVITDGGRAAAGFTGKTGDCVTRAIAIATGLPYQQVYDALNEREKAQPRRSIKRGSSRTGVNKDVIKTYLAALGWRWTPTMSIGSGCTVHLTDGEIPMVGRLIVSVSRHITAVIDGVIHDTHDPQREGEIIYTGNPADAPRQTGGRCVYGYWSQP